MKAIPMEMLWMVPPAWLNHLPRAVGWAPKALPEDRLMGGMKKFTLLDIEWKESKLANVAVRSLAGGACRLRCGAATRDLALAKGQSAQWDGQ